MSNGTGRGTNRPKAANAPPRTHAAAKPTPAKQSASSLTVTRKRADIKGAPSAETRDVDRHPARREGKHAAAPQPATQAIAPRAARTSAAAKGTATTDVADARTAGEPTAAARLAATRAARTPSAGNGTATTEVAGTPTAGKQTATQHAMATRAARTSAAGNGTPTTQIADMRSAGKPTATARVAAKRAAGIAPAGTEPAGEGTTRKPPATPKAVSAKARGAGVSSRTDGGKSVGKRAAGASRVDGGGKSVAKRAGAESEGWHGWDEYAAFYDWENARTVGRRDVAFWRDLALRTGGRTLELGCGTGRILTPLARAGVPIVGIDRSAPMLARAETRVKRVRRNTANSAPVALLRGDIRQLPFEPGTFDLVMAPYGILQSLVRDRDLADTLRAVFAALAPGGRFGLDLVPDVPRWEEYSRRVSLRGRRGPRGVPVTLVESVRQDRARRLTIFDQEFIEGQGRARRVHRFSLMFRTVSIQSLRARLEQVGFTVDAVLGGYDGRPWDPRADIWVLLASKPK